MGRLLFLIALWVVPVRLAFADAAPVLPEAPPSAAPASIVVLAPVPPAYRDAIRDHGASVGLEVRAGAAGAGRPLARALEVSAQSPPLGVFWLEERPSGTAIYLYEPRGQGVFIREVERAQGERDAALIESIGLIVASTAVALREGRELGMRRVDDTELAKLDPQPEPKPEPAEPPPTVPPPPQPEPAAPAEPARGVGLRFAVSYLGDGFNRRAPWQSGARGHFGVIPHRLLRLGLSYGFIAPATVGGDPRLRLSRHEVALELGVGGEVGKRLLLHGTLFAAVDAARWRTDGRSGIRPLARLGPMFEIGVRIVGGLYFDLGLGAAATLSRVDFVVCESPDVACSDEDRDVVAGPWPIAPRLTAGLSYVHRLARSR